jgi:hypothetical protein
MHFCWCSFTRCREIKKGRNTLKKHRMFVEIRGTGKITILGIDTQVLH